MSRRKRKVDELEEFGLTEEMVYDGTYAQWSKPIDEFDDEDYCPAGVQRQLCIGCSLAEKCRWLIIE